MNRHPNRTTHSYRSWNSRRRSLTALVALTTIAFGAVGCGSKSDAKKKSKSAASAPTKKFHAPSYTFAPGLRDTNPELARFLRAFLETCLTGDYPGYRKFVSRRQNPEPKDRFERIYNAISKLTVSTIEEVQIDALPSPVYRVVSDVEFVEGKQPVFGEDRRSIAILVFREENEWRIIPAPSKLQPERIGRGRDDEVEPPATTSAPVEYPWDQTGDE